MKSRPIFGHVGALTALFAALALTGCVGIETRPASPDKPVAETRQGSFKRSGYACCNLHYNGDWISDSNFAQLPFIPAGTPIKVRKIDGYRASVEIDGKSMWLGQDYGRGRETTEQWVNKLVVLEDPRPKIARFSPAVRSAIAAGQLAKGMTREQVIHAVGYPQTDENLPVDGPYWRYWWSSIGPYYVYWSKTGTVIKIDGYAETVARMTYNGK